MRKGRKSSGGIISVFFILVVCAFLMYVPFWKTEAEIKLSGINEIKTTELGVETRSQQDIEKYLSSVKAANNQPSSNVDQQAEEMAISQINACRYIAGLKQEVELDDSYTQLAYYAALSNYETDQMTHFPSRPEGMDDKTYALCQEGARNSNLAVSTDSKEELVHMIELWMSDSDEKNCSLLGHRRWILNPQMGKTGFGLVQGSKGSYSAMYAVDNSGSGSQDTLDSEGEICGVAWPASNMPLSYFKSEDPWSLSLGKPLETASVKVKLVREADGKSWEFSQEKSDGLFNVDDNYYGQRGCIIFRPDGIGGLKAGDSFQVTIAYNNKYELIYNVRFF